jgi:transcription elongation GreA/GreB family factor
MTTDANLHQHINDLVAEEHELRRHGGLDDAGRERLTHIEEQLDTLWDLLRRREAARDAGTDPDAVKPASTTQVEGYLQ